ncbi:hypothetical protein LP419_19220 [Massilia sp. H-1]|nr:hypothetical protein LP419_19220 [Massilia sp. H-1]
MVAFLRQYRFFDGIDIDYEHPTTNNAIEQSARLHTVAPTPGGPDEGL